MVKRAQCLLLVLSYLLSTLSYVSAASSWGYDEATISIHGKGAGVGGGEKEK